MDRRWPASRSVRRSPVYASAAFWSAILAVVVLVAASRSDADALVGSQAMLASTIAEFYIEEDRVRLLLEISRQDLPAFANLLPNEILEQMGLEALPLSERSKTFFEHDLAIASDSGERLVGRILEIGPQPRVRRDELTGEPLAADPEAPPETRVFARLEYALPGRPESLTIFGPRTGPPVSVGFVAYHRGVAVNDFRYLSPQQTLVLDWDDPWYSHFERRALRRQYFAPMSGFLYIEPYEVRKEIILRPLDLQRWVDLGIADLSVIPGDRQAEITRAIGEFLLDHHPVRIDGAAITPELDRVNFLERTLRTSRVVEPGTDVDIFQAVVGAIYVYPTDGLPQQVSMEWDLWDDRIPKVPVSAVDQAGGMPGVLEADHRVLTWQNFLKFPEVPTLEELALPPGPLTRAMSVARWVFLGLLAASLAVLLQRRSPTRRAAVAAFVCLTAAAFVWGRGATLSEEAAREVVSGLLHNIYRAFDYRSDERIYDALAASTDGAVLERTYLETRKGLELASQGGARARVKEVELVDLSLAPAADGGFRTDVIWNVAGAVGHWGHIHERRNQYQAELTIAPVDGAWKLVDLEIIREERR